MPRKDSIDIGELTDSAFFIFSSSYYFKKYKKYL